MATIEKRGKSYRITASVGYDMSGKQVRPRMTWTPPEGMTPKKIKKEIDRQAALFEDKVKSGCFIDNNIKFADFADKWINEYADKQLAPATVASYKKYLKRTNAAIGHIRLNKLQPSNLIEFYNNLAEEGIREDYKYRALIDLNTIFKEKNLSRKNFQNKFIFQKKHYHLRVKVAILVKLALHPYVKV